MIQTATMVMASLLVAHAASAQQYQFVFDRAEPLPEMSMGGRDATIHTQGLYVTDDVYWVTGRLESQPKRALLLRFSRKDLHRYEFIDITPPKIDDATLDHPGGFDADSEGTLWIPVSTSDPAGPTLIYRVSVKPGQPLSSAEAKVAFRVNDHIGAVCISKDGSLIGANWDTKRVYQWSPNGDVLRRIDRNRLFAGTPQWQLAVQDWKGFELDEGAVIIAGGLDKSRGASTATIQLIDVVHGEIHESHRFSSQENVSRPITNEGLDVHKRTLFLLPEDIGRGAKILRYRIDAVK